MKDRFIIAVLIAILLLGVFISPYREVDSHYIVNPKAHEKVCFDAVYLGITTWGDEDVLYYMPPANYDVFEVGGEHVFLEGDCYSHNLCGNETRTFHLKGEFTDDAITTQPMGDELVAGHFFNATCIEPVNI